jgi:hypothetical protein
MTVMGRAGTGRSDVDEEADPQTTITIFRGRRPDILRSHASRNAARPRRSQPKLPYLQLTTTSPAQIRQDHFP